MKIKKIEIESFRGISNNVTIDFSKKDKPISTIIFGDNGTGKSSIIDALEFNLQGKLERSESLQNEFRASIINLNNKITKGSKTNLTFADNSTSARDIVVIFDNDKEKYIYNRSTNGINKSFQIAPIALRRNDIINYSLIPSERKQVLFWSFIYNTKNSVDTPEEIVDANLINELNNDKLQLKNRRREIIKQISSILKIASENIPISGNELDNFIKIQIRNGLTSSEYLKLNKNGNLKGVNKDAVKKGEELLTVNQELKINSDKLLSLKKSNTSSGGDRKQDIKLFLDEASKFLTDAFLEISTLNFIKHIRVKIGQLTDVSFEIEILLQNGVKTAPNKIFSEANLDLLILLLYTSIIKESSKYGQSKVIILDDVLQSVDSIIRISFIEYLLTNFKDWQIILTTHDRLWLNQLRSSFRRNGHQFKEIEIYKWDFNTGLNIFEQNFKTQNSSLNIAIETKDNQLIASQTGLFLEFICNILSMKLNISIQRKIEDKYTIGDLWPGILKHFKKSKLNQNVLEIDKLLHIRNLFGAHYNEWAISLSNTEVNKFASLVNDFYISTFCEKCENWITKDNNCSCKNLNIEL
jgi:hypothetical protein